MQHMRHMDHGGRVVDIRSSHSLDLQPFRACAIRHVHRHRALLLDRLPRSLRLYSSYLGLRHLAVSATTRGLDITAAARPTSCPGQIHRAGRGFPLLPQRVGYWWWLQLSLENARRIWGLRGFRHRRVCEIVLASFSFATRTHREGGSCAKVIHA